MFDEVPMNEQDPMASSLRLFDRAMRIRVIKDDIVRAAQQLDGLNDKQLAEIGVNRSDIEDTIRRYI